MKYEDLKATIYTKSEFFGNIVKREVKLHEITEKTTYAQYHNAVKATFTIKRKRSKSSLVTTYQPYVVIVAGWDHPNPADMFDIVEKTDTMTIKKSSYMSFDDRFATDFDAIVDSGKLGEVILDARHTKGFSSH